MKFSDLKYMFSNYEQALWSPTRSAIRLGCDCGCGGDSYTQETWDAEEEQARISIGIMKAWCIAHNIEWDGDE